MKINVTFFFALTLFIGSFSCTGTSQEKDVSDETTVPVKVSDEPATTLVEDRLKEMGIELPEAPPPVANYVNAVRVGNLIFLAGKGPNKPEGGYITGKVGQDLTIEEGYEAARLTAIQHLAVLKAELGNLDKVKRLVKVHGMVNCTPDFTNQPEVVNGYSDFMVEVFGDKGKHARAAVGMGSLPRGIAVEVELVVEVTD